MARIFTAGIIFTDLLSLRTTESGEE